MGDNESPDQPGNINDSAIGLESINLTEDDEVQSQRQDSGRENFQSDGNQVAVPQVQDANTGAQ